MGEPSRERTEATPAPADSIAALRSILRRVAAQVLADAAGLPPPSSPLSCVAGDEVLSVTVLLVPAGTKAERPFSPCERDILALLEASSTRLSTSRVVEELAASGRLHGDSTVGHALTRLVKLGLIRSSRRAPRGYYLPGKAYSLLLAAGG